jgi:hypothetical protein
MTHHQAAPVRDIGDHRPRPAPLPANDPYPQVSADESEITILSVDAAR